ncbi:hypothetical protein AAMO2058_000063600 [Amorphochlora amoebiformis]
MRALGTIVVGVYLTFHVESAAKVRIKAAGSGLARKIPHSMVSDRCLMIKGPKKKTPLKSSRQTRALVHVAQQQGVLGKNEVSQMLGLGGYGFGTEQLTGFLSSMFGGLHTSPAIIHGANEVLHRANAIFALLWLLTLRFQILRWLQSKLQQFRRFVVPKSSQQEPLTYERSIYPPLETPLEVLSWWTLLVSYLFGTLANLLNASKLAWHIALAQTIAGRVAIGWLILNYITYFKEKSSRGRATFGDILGADTSRRESQVSAVAQTLRVVVIFATLLSALDSVGVNVGRILALSGLGGLAFGWFGRDILSNIIGGLMVYLTQPFAQGDWVQSTDGTIDGWVQNVGIYYTVVMRWDKRPLYIPNSKLSMLEIINASRMTNRRILLEIPLKLRDSDQFESIVHEIRELIQNHEDIDPRMHRLARLRDITPYSANVWLSCYTKSILLADYTEVREKLILAIHEILHDHKTTFASNIERIQVVDPGRKYLIDTRKQLQNTTTFVEKQLSSIQSNRTFLMDWESELKLLSEEVRQRSETSEKRAKSLDDMENMLKKLEESLTFRGEALDAREAAIGKEKLALKTREKEYHERESRLGSITSRSKEDRDLDRDLLELEKEALKAKEQSLTKTEQAMETMRSVLDSRGEQLMQEREEQLLELLDSTDPSDPDATEKTKEKGDVEGKKKEKEKKEKKDKDDGGEPDDDETEEERLKALEKAATAIGGE